MVCFRLYCLSIFDGVPVAEPRSCLPKRQVAFFEKPCSTRNACIPNTSTATLPMAYISDSQLLSAYDAWVRDQLAHSILPAALRSARPAQSASAIAESTSRPFGKSSSFISRVTDKNRMRRFKAMRSETVGAEACLASCPTEYCRSGRSTDRNNRRPTRVRMYECSSRSSGVSSMTRSFTPAVAHFLVEFASPESCTMSSINCGLIISLNPLTVRSSIQPRNFTGGLPGSRNCTSLKSMVCPMSSVNSLTLVWGPTAT